MIAHACSLFIYLGVKERNIFPSDFFFAFVVATVVFYSIFLFLYIPLLVLVVRIHIIRTRTAQHVYQYITLQ